MKSLRLFLLEFLVPALLAPVVLILIAVVLAVVAFMSKAAVDDLLYARRLFADKIDVTRIVASKRWHDFTDDWFACTYAVVEFSKRSAERLQRVGPLSWAGEPWALIDHGRPTDAGWTRTPMARPPGHYPNPVDECLDEIPERASRQISDSLRATNSWYYVSDDTTVVLSLEHRLAATFRYGD